MNLANPQGEETPYAFPLRHTFYAPDHGHLYQHPGAKKYSSSLRHPSLPANPRNNNIGEGEEKGELSSEDPDLIQIK